MITAYQIVEDDEEFYGKEKIISNDGYDMVTEIKADNGDLLINTYKRVAAWQLQDVKRTKMEMNK